MALCPELEVASQGETIEQARDNLQKEEVTQRFRGEVFVTQVEVAVG